MAFVLFSCGASASFNYRVYVLEADKYEGKLKARDPKNDLELSECAPSSNVKDKCYVFKREEIMRLRTDYESMQDQLKCWQSGRCKN